MMQRLLGDGDGGAALCRRLNAVLLVVAVAAGPVLAEDGADNEKRDQRLQKMRRRAEATKVSVVDDENSTKRHAVKPVPQPVFRYDDQPRGIRDATLWCYGTKGRPVALQKVENYRREGPFKWLYCLTSLTGDLVEVQWQDEANWSSTKPALEMKMLPGGPQPAESKTLRLLQMKRLMQRFAAEIHDPLAGVRETMRGLPRPIYRYAAPATGLQDGAIFGFASNGTNPDLLVLIELHKGSNSSVRWKYGCARLSSGNLTVRLDGMDVWEAPFVRPSGYGRASRFDTWLFFWENLAAADE